MDEQIGWAELNEQTSGYNFAQCSRNEDRAVFCALHLKLSEVLSQIRHALGGSGKQLRFLHVFADTVLIDEPLLPAASTVIVARSLILDAPEMPLVAPDPKTGPGGVTAIQVLTAEVEGGSLMLMTRDSKPVRVVFTEAGPCAIRFVSGERLKQSTAGASMLDLLRHPIAWNGIKASFDAAALLSEGNQDDRRLATSMLRWVYRGCSLIATEEGPFRLEAADLASQAGSLLVQMGVEENSAYVPVLSQDYYAQSIGGLLTVLQNSERQMEQLALRADIQNALREISAAMADSSKAEARPIELAAANTLGELLALQKQYDALEWQFLVQSKEVDFKRMVFQHALEEKLMWDKIKVAVDLLKAVIDMVAAVGSLVAGPEAAAIPAAAAMNSVDAAITTLGSVAEGLGEMDHALRLALECMKAAGSEMQKLQKALADIAKAGNTLYSAADKASSTLPKLAKIPNLAAPDWAEIAKMDPEMEWRVFADKIEAGLKKFVDDKVVGAREYLGALKVLAEYGKAMSGKGIAIVHLQARYLELQAELKANETIEKRWRTLEAESQDDGQKKRH